MTTYHSIEWKNGVVIMLDQRQLPHNTEYLNFTDYQSVAAAIKDMVIRGAPAIGAAAAYGLALTAYPPHRCKPVLGCRSDDGSHQ